ncbi:MAG: hypothetical protein CFE35_02755 [Novosphingobium sp. PASSN1]|nr:MAG: hypothetical protein CFE35_02755 [Novosphingobium sp. PASSN1]
MRPLRAAQTTSISATSCAEQSILSIVGPQDIARAFKSKRAATVRPVLDSLADIGMARRRGDGC